MSCGEMDFCSSSNHLLIGLNHHLYHQTIFQKRRKKYLCECNKRITCCTIQSLLKLQSPERITAWVFRFINKCRKPKQNLPTIHLSTLELLEAERYWIKIIQHTYFPEVKILSRQGSLNPSSPLLPLHPFVDSAGLLRVGGRQQHSSSTYESKHPVILTDKHPLTRLIIRTEHLRLLHAGPTLLSASLSQ